MSMAFKAPKSLPQDLLLISEFIDIPKVRQPTPQSPKDDDDIASSDSGEDSEEEVEKNLIAIDEEEDGNSLPNSGSSSSSSSDTSSDSESEDEKNKATEFTLAALDVDDEDDPALNAGGLPLTKHEVIEAIINIPEIETVGSEEHLEKVGEVMSIMDNVVIIKGLASEIADRGSDRALDSDTLLVFEDRKVLGYIYETFGPTCQPLYQVKFNQNYPLDPQKVTLGRQVFHVPGRSNFVFVSQIKRFKGCDASNVYDEEPADEELEFSDDEAEAAYRNSNKRKRAESRARSVASSRQSTPGPAQMRDQDMMFDSVLSKNAYDEQSPYDLDYGATTSRPSPRPYDDPYSDAYNMIGPGSNPESRTSAYTHTSRTREVNYPISGDVVGRGRGRGRGRRGGHNNISRGTFRRDGGDSISTGPTENYDPHLQYVSRPAPYFQAQNSYPFNTMQPHSSGWNHTYQLHDQNHQPYMFNMSNMSAGPSYHPPYTDASTFVQPHINPRFAATFGLQAPSAPLTSLRRSPNSLDTQVNNQPTNNWTEQWAAQNADHPMPKREDNDRS